MRGLARLRGLEAGWKGRNTAPIVVESRSEPDTLG